MLRWGCVKHPNSEQGPSPPEDTRLDPMTLVISHHAPLQHHHIHHRDAENVLATCMCTLITPHTIHLTEAKLISFPLCNSSFLSLVYNPPPPPLFCDFAQYSVLLPQKIIILEVWLIRKSNLFCYQVSKLIGINSSQRFLFAVERGLWTSVDLAIIPLWMCNLGIEPPFNKETKAKI